MKINCNITKIENYLTQHGWTLSYAEGDYDYFYKPCDYEIQVYDYEVVTIDRKGKRYYIPLNNKALYTLVGYMHMHLAR